MQQWEHINFEYYWKAGTFGGGGYEAEVGGKKLKGSEVLKHIADLGAQGWEMVSAVPYAHGNHYYYCCWFKRPVQPG